MPRLSRTLAVFIPVWLASAPAPGTDLLPLEGPWRCGSDPAKPQTYQPARLPSAHRGDAALRFRLDAPVPAPWAGFDARLRVMATGFVEAAVNGQRLGRRLATPLGATFDVTEVIRPGAPNTIEIAISATRPGRVAELRACRLEAGGRLAPRLARPSLFISPSGAVVELDAQVVNRSGARFDGRLWMKLWRAGEQRPMWQRRRDFRAEPQRPAQFAEIAQIREPVLWRHDSPRLYPLLVSVTTRTDELISECRRHIGLRAVQVEGQRWVVGGEWTRLAAVATHVPGAWLLNPNPASVRLGTQEELSKLPLPEVLERCDAAGTIALVEVPAPAALDAEALEAMVADLATQAAWHPCIWGWLVDGPAAGAVAAVLRRTRPRLPVGTERQAAESDPEAFDFVALRLQTSAVRRGDDDFARKLDDCRRRIPRKAIVVLDHLQPANPGDFASIARSVATRCGHANRRSECAIVGFAFEANDDLLTALRPALCPFSLKPPGHQVRREKNKTVVKTWFDGGLRSPVAGWMPCYSLRGASVRWRAEAGSSVAASGNVALPACRPSPQEGGPQGRPHAETQWLAPGPGTIEFTAELTDAAGRPLLTRRQRLKISVKPDGKPELRVEQLE